MSDLADNPDNPVPNSPVTTRFKHRVQLLLCDGCCCGKREHGHQEVPVKFFQREWTRRKLVREVYLTPCYCLGPCDAANVVGVLSALSATWFGNLAEVDDYAAVLDWVQALVDSQLDALNPPTLPERLQDKTLERFASPS